MGFRREGRRKRDCFRSGEVVKLLLNYKHVKVLADITGNAIYCQEPWFFSKLSHSAVQVPQFPTFKIGQAALASFRQCYAAKKALKAR